MRVAIHEAQGKKILVVSDEDVIGKRYVEGNVQLDLTSEFYKGEVVSDDDIRRMMRGAYIIHMVGRKSVQMGIDEGFVDQMSVKKIKGIPHAEVLL